MTASPRPQPTPCRPLLGPRQLQAPLRPPALRRRRPPQAHRYLLRHPPLHLCLRQPPLPPSPQHPPPTTRERRPSVPGLWEEVPIGSEPGAPLQAGPRAGAGAGEAGEEVGVGESAKGPRRVRLAAGMSAKMHKYRTAARDLLDQPAVGCGVGDEIRRAGFAVRLVACKPDAADAALRRELVRLMERRSAGCVVLVSDDLGFAGLVGMARERGVRTVVVGDDAGGGLRRCADSGFLWREVVSGKARKEAGVVVGRWKDREVLKRLEETYRPGRGEEVGDEMDDSSSEMEEGVGQWWELDSDEDRLHRLENSNMIGED